MSALVVTEDTSRDEIIEALRNLCDGAKAMRRRGLVGIRSAGYEKQHELIDNALYDLEMWG